MDLLLWRHAEAEEAGMTERRLTERGERQACSMGSGYASISPRICAFVVSPAVRTQQTAEALKLPIETTRSARRLVCRS